MLNEARDLDVFVSSYLLMEHKESPFYHSTTTWTETAHTWLARAETISFNAFESGEVNFIGEARFDDVLNQFGELMKPLGFIPERYEVIDFPNKEQLEKILINN